MLKFLKLKEEYLQTVLEWRVKPEVARYMLTNVEYDLSAQRMWFERISRDPSCNYWVIEYGGIPIGLFNLAAIDKISRKCSAGYYIGAREYRQLGAMVPPYFYNYVFNDMRFHKIYGEVVEGNDNVLKMHRLHGYRQVGVYKDHLFKDERFQDVFLIELLAETWLSQKKYRKYVVEWE